MVPTHQSKGAARLGLPVGTQHAANRMLCHKPLSGQRPSARCSVAQPARRQRVVRSATAAAAAPAVAKKEEVAPKNSDGDGTHEEKVVHDVPDPRVSSKQVASFLQTLVEDTDIAELHLQVGTFDLKVRRSIASTPPPAPQPSYAPAAVLSPASSLGSVDMASVSTAETIPSVESMDESLVYVNSPKVGIFRRGKYAAGKRVGKGNMVTERDQVKKGQALGYVEQLGTHFPIEAPQAGEVVKFMLEDGAPVEYQQLVVEIAPFFGGHIIGDMKHA